MFLQSRNTLDYKARCGIKCTPQTKDLHMKVVKHFSTVSRKTRHFKILNETLFANELGLLLYGWIYIIHGCSVTKLSSPWPGSGAKWIWIYVGHFVIKILSLLNKQVNSNSAKYYAASILLWWYKPKQPVR